MTVTTPPVPDTNHPAPTTNSPTATGRGSKPLDTQ